MPVTTTAAMCALPREFTQHVRREVGETFGIRRSGFGAPTGEQCQTSRVNRVDDVAYQVGQAGGSLEAAQTRPPPMRTHCAVPRRRRSGTFDGCARFPHLAQERWLEEPECGGHDVGIDIAENSPAAGHVKGESVGVPEAATRPEHLGIEHPPSTDIARRGSERVNGFRSGWHVRNLANFCGRLQSAAAP